MSDPIGAARDEAIDRVEEHASAEWLEEAYEQAFSLAILRDAFTSEDVWDRLDGVVTHEPRAMGAVMRRLRANGVVEPTDTFVRSTSPRGHGRPSRVWKSRVFGQLDARVWVP